MLSRHHPTALRNRTVVLDAIKTKILSEVSTPPKRWFEIASGTGAHVELFSENFPSCTFLPSEYVSPAPEDAPVTTEVHEATFADSGKISGALSTDLGELEAIDAVGSSVRPNVLPAIAVDASTPFETWDETARSWRGKTDFVYVGNVTHISPFQVTLGILDGVSELLTPETGRFALYGPFGNDGEIQGEGNVKFDKNLRLRNPEWGYRMIQDVEKCANDRKLVLLDALKMPANNYMLVFAKL